VNWFGLKRKINEANECRRSLFSLSSTKPFFENGWFGWEERREEELGGRRQQQSTSPLHNQSHQSTKRKTKSCLFFGLIENWFVGGAGLNAEWGGASKSINSFLNFLHKLAEGNGKEWLICEWSWNGKENKFIFFSFTFHSISLSLNFIPMKIQMKARFHSIIIN